MIDEELIEEIENFLPWLKNAETALIARAWEAINIRKYLRDRARYGYYVWAHVDYNLEQVSFKIYIGYSEHDYIDVPFADIFDPTLEQTIIAQMDCADRIAAEHKLAEEKAAAIRVEALERAQLERLKAKYEVSGS